jgi:hypothetical protein
MDSMCKLGFDMSLPPFDGGKPVSAIIRPSSGDYKSSKNTRISSRLLVWCMVGEQAGAVRRISDITGHRG